MTLVDIKIYGRYSRDGTFTEYWYDCGVGDAIDSTRKGLFLAGHSSHEKDLRKIAEKVVFDVLDEGVTDPEYRIRLSEGHHPLRKCRKGCPHLGYTQRPDEKLKAELTDLLHDKDVIAKAQAKHEYYQKNPVKIVFL